MNKRILFTLTLSLISTGLMAGDIENQQLLNAVRHNDVAGVQAAIEKRADVNTRGINGNTPLHLAVLNPNTPERTKIIALLVISGAQINLPNATNQLPADLARNLPGFEDIQALLGEDTCAVCIENITPNADIVRGKTLFGCDPRHIFHRACLFDEANNQKTVRCPRCRATRNEPAARAEGLALTLNYFAEQEEFLAAMQIANITNEHALIHAAEIGDLAQVQALLARGVNVNAHTNNGWTALMAAASHGSADIVTILLARPGIEVNAIDIRGWTALITAAANNNVAAINALLAHPDIDVNAHDIQHWTALMHATHNANIRIIKALLAHPGIDVNVIDIFGNTALMRAAGSGNATAITAFLAHPNINVNANDNNGWTALMLAAEHGNTAAITTLLAHPDIDLNARNSCGVTALMCAARYGNTAAITTLLAHPNIDVNARANAGNTALMIAAIHGFSAAITALLAHPDIDINAHNNEGNTALMIATQNGSPNAAQLLVEHGAH